MCGIAGFISNAPVTETRERVCSMLADLARRGPDAEGLESWPSGAVLGHRRLSIFDLSDDGRQPMMSPDRKVAVVFNGAIYNFRSLRDELQRSGYEFRSRTDTEVLVHGYREWGIDALVERLRGMFAFAIWDEQSRTLSLVRDRLGVKPLLYHVSGRGVSFASTVRALRTAGEGDDIDPQAVLEFLEYGFVSEHRTIYQGISKVPAAHILQFKDGRLLSRRQYWHLSEPTARIGFEEAVEETERLFLEAVKLRLDADVPVGSLLSGGVDSALVCWGVAHHGADITAFTVGTPGDPDDETNDAVAAAKKIGIRHQIIPLSPEAAPPVSELVSAYGEPFACSSALGMMSVSQAVKPLATVLLTGDGGDDVFLGYPGHRHFWQAQKLAQKVPPFAAQGWYSLRVLPKRIGALRRPVHFADYITGGIGAVTRAHDGLPFYQRNGFLGQRLAGARLPQREIEWSPERGRRILPDYLEYEHQYKFFAEYMTKVDGGSMYHALEARSPFLDQKLWEFASSLPYDVRLHGGELKAILRELARRKIGEHVASGKKRGFSIPVNRWIPGRWKTAVEELFRASRLAEEGWLQRDALLRELNRSTERGFATNHLWYCYVLESWFREQHQPAIPDQISSMLA